MAPATTRRCTSFKCGMTVVKNRASSSRLASTRPAYYARTKSRGTFTVDLALLGFLAALLHQVLQVHGDRKWWALGVWCAAALFAVFGTAAATAVMAVKATFSGIDTTQVTTWDPPVLRQLAADYGKAVRVGEMTVALRVTIFRQATRVSVLAAFVGAVAFGLSA